jgi:hypothetical protein
VGSVVKLDAKRDIPEAVVARAAMKRVVNCILMVLELERVFLAWQRWNEERGWLGGQQ